MRIKQLIGLILLLSGFSNLTGQAYRIQESIVAFKSEILNREIRYSVILPEDYFKSGGKTYPVVYFLHGLGDNETSWLEYGNVAKYVDSMTAEKAIEPFICVMPQGFSAYYSNFYDHSFPYQDMFVREFVPYIDAQYRTEKKADKRAVIGYSMGGFGALVLPVKYPDVFRISIPLSASIRTDAQYITEEQKEWNEQWGKIFGGVNAVGKDRLTDYYIKNSPFHLLESKDLNELKKISFYIENGDKENTLCRSNEELHILMLKKDIPHIYNVKSGGHQFAFWQAALPGAFRFADAKFRNIRFEVQEKAIKANGQLSEHFFSEQISTASSTFRAVYPECRKNIARKYPVVYFVSDLTVDEQNTLLNLYRQAYQLEKNISPLIFCFVPAKYGNALSGEIIPYMEQKRNARQGRRFRAIWMFEKTDAAAMQQIFEPDRYTVAALTAVDLPWYEKEVQNLINRNLSVRNQLWFYIDTPSHGSGYFGNGYLHVNLRENGFTDEYRVRNGKNNFEFLKSGFIPVLTYINRKFHY